MRERDLQVLIVDYLELHGYTVLQLGGWRRRTVCPRCGHAYHPRGGTSTPGAPDLLLWHPHAVPAGGAGALCLWVAAEVKTERGRLRPEQRALAEAGAIAVVRSLEDMQQALVEHGMPVPIGSLDGVQ